MLNLRGGVVVVVERRVIIKLNLPRQEWSWDGHGAGLSNKSAKNEDNDMKLSNVTIGVPRDSIRYLTSPGPT